jgi:rubrerythrin
MNPYEFAVQMSRDGEKFFRTLARQLKNPGLRKIMLMLAEDQSAHGRDFAKMNKAEGKALPSSVDFAGGSLNPFAQRLKRLGLGEKPDESLPPEELYRRGQALDQECEDFYRKRAARVRDPRLREAYLRVAEEQRKHYFTIEHLINFISESRQGLENAEWSVAEPPE